METKKELRKDFWKKKVRPYKTKGSPETRPGCHRHGARRHAAFWEAEEKERQWLHDCGMAEEDIDRITAFDLKLYRADRRQMRHDKGQSYEDVLELYEKEPRPGERRQGTVPSSMISDPDTFGPADPAYWVEELDTPALAAAVKSLDPADLELLTLYAMEGKTQCQIAVLRGVSQKTVSRRLEIIRSILQKALK